MAHTYTNLLIHALWSTKGREPLLDAEIKPQLFAYMAGVLKRLGGKPLLLNGPRDQVHMLFVAPPTVALSELVKKIKANSSKWVHKQWPQRRSFGWQTGFTAFSVSHSQLPKVRKYIARQEEHHRRLTYQEEVLAFFNRQGIEYDPRFVFD